MNVSIPRSGFCSFKLSAVLSISPARLRFQSLGRDSVHSSRIQTIRATSDSSGFNPSVGILFIQAPSGGFCVYDPQSFNPSVGILFIQAYLFDVRGSDDANVSIPRSGFCSFKRRIINEYMPKPGSFNPSVGILFIQAPSSFSQEWRGGQFQSLGRDSVHSSIERSTVPDVGLVVSIPRSGFCSFKLKLSPRQTGQLSGFNPSVGILFIQAHHPHCHPQMPLPGFNPSVGILFIQAG